MLADRDLEIRWISERHLRLGGPLLSDAATVHAASACLRRAAIPGVVDLSPAHLTILLEFDDPRIDTSAAERSIRAALTELGCEPASVTRRIEIPVCFELALGPDLTAIAAHCGRSVAAFVDEFVSATYSVRFLGFLPGFGYLDGLPSVLAMPRRASPRPRVEAGSVGIAAKQAGVYPFASPGGWQIVGRTPLRMFDPSRDPPALLCAGDTVRFVPISPTEFERAARERK